MVNHGAVHRVRRAAGVLALVALIVPATAMLPDTKVNLTRWQRLRSTGRIAPDSGQDAANRQLRLALPASGNLGFHSTGPRGTGQQLFFLQYSLAPRVVVESIEHEFVIESGPADSPASLAHDARFARIPVSHEDLRLFKRVSK